MLLLSTLLLVQQPTLGRAPFNGLNATVKSIKFFESAGAIPDSKQRVITTRFDALTTRFINFELELAYSPAPKDTPFQVDCRFDGPDGKPRERTVRSTIAKGWTGSYHAAGLGSSERGTWPVGIYKVSCVEEGKPIVGTQIEVVKSVAAVGKLGAAIVQMKFFQSLAQRLPIETRRYSTRFDNRTAGWIKTEFALVYPQVATATTFSVECAYVFPDKSVKRVTVERLIPAGWTGSVHDQGIDAAGLWAPGKYTVSCWNNGEKMAEAPFEVYDGGAALALTAGGQLRFSTAGAAPEKAFPLGGYDSLFVEASVPVRVMADSAAFGCLLTDPAGITSAFALKGQVNDKDKLLVGRGPVGTLDPPKLRGTYRVECRTGKAVVLDHFEVTGPGDPAQLDARLVNAGLFAGEEEPGDESVGDAVFSAAKLKTLWLVALFDHPTATGSGTLSYSCKVATGPRNLAVAESGPQQLSLAAADRIFVLKSKLTSLPRQRWAPGKYTVGCVAAGASLLKLGFDVTR